MAGGKLAAEAVAAFADRPYVLRAMEGLPLARQRELAGGAVVQVLQPGGGSQPMSLAVIPTSVVTTIFSGGQERTPDEQRLVSSAVAKRKKVEPRTYRVVVDKAARTVQVGRMTVSVEEVLAALTESASRDVPYSTLSTPGAKVSTATCFLTADELDRLNKLAEAKRVDPGELVRLAVVSLLL